jgi:diguanylate cyclase (GGDEF)-like protein
MNLLVITQHGALVDRLRTAFEGAGHTVTHVEDQVQALATEAWIDNQILLVDAAGDPLDGYRLCQLLRGESRHLFQNLGIFIILEAPPTEADLLQLGRSDADGFLSREDGIQQLIRLLGPALGGDFVRASGPPVPILAAGLRKATLDRIQGLLRHFHFDLHAHALREIPAARADLNASILLLGIHSDSNRTLADLKFLREAGGMPYVMLLGRPPEDALQRKLFFAGVADWLPLPLSEPRLLHGCRRALEYLHAQRIKREFEQQIGELRERRVLLEMEAASLRNEVLTDPLTGLLNRRAFDQNLQHAIHQWERHRRGFVLILSDVDHFKLVNDRFGHLVGDQVLKGLAQRMKNALRRSDLAFRIGGEEFAVILTETTLKAGTEVAEKLRRRIDQEPILLDGGQTVFPTMSFGVGAPDSDSPEHLFHRVDQALYRVKNAGRNGVEVAGG